MKVATTKQVYKEKTQYFQPFVSAFLYPQGLKAFFAQSDLLMPKAKIMDAGCGTGFLSIAYMKALREKGSAPQVVNAFDLMPGMLNIFEHNLERANLRGVDLQEGNALEMDRLPQSWTSYDLILSASMMEHLPKEAFPKVLAEMKARLSPGGKVLLFITRKNPLNRILIEWLWSTHSYTQSELNTAFRVAGFNEIKYHRFPTSYAWLNLWGHIVEAS